MTAIPPSLYVGIDVAKAHLDIALRPHPESWRVVNDAAGIAHLIARLDALHPALIVLEATGGYERPLVVALTAAALPVAVVNPRQVRDFAKATGKLAKTDALDAAVLAHFADAVRPAPRPVSDAHTHALAAVLVRRRQLVAMLTAEQNRHHTAPLPMQQRIAVHLAWLEAELDDLDKELVRVVQSDPVWREHAALLRNAPGVGPVLTTTPLAELPNWAS